MVVGLANPGAEYEGTRHNVGAEVVATLAARSGAKLKRAVGRALSGEARLAGKLVVLATPSTYMNDSGQDVAPLVRRYLDDASRLVVVHDELDLPLGTVRLKEGGGIAGHNGLRSVKAHLHTADFARVRVGIGKPPGRQAGADYVLRRPGKAERTELDVSVETAADAVEAVVAEGMGPAMNRYNTRDKE